MSLRGPFAALIACMACGCAASGAPQIDTPSQKLAKGMPTFAAHTQLMGVGPLVGAKAPHRRKPEGHRGPLATSGKLYFDLYKATFSRLDGPTCRFSPSCSSFGLHATSAHGAYGLVASFGRLQRWQNDDDFYPAKGPLLLDPISNYVFWFASPAPDTFERFDDPAHAWYMHVDLVEP